MNAAQIFAPAYSYLLARGKKATNKQIAEDTGISVNRLSLLKQNPDAAKVSELEALTNAYHYSITI